MGARIARSMGMEGSTGNQRRFPINPSNTGKIFTGDFVKLTSGLIVEASGGANNVDFDLLGIFMGCEFIDADGSKRFERHWSGASGRSECWATVSVPVGSTILIPAIAANNYTAADVGRRKGIVYEEGNEKTGRSGITLSAAGTAGNTTGPLIFLGNADIPGENLIECSIVRSQALPALNV